MHLLGYQRAVFPVVHKKKGRKKKIKRVNVGVIGRIHDFIFNHPLFVSLFPMAFVIHFIDVSLNYPKSDFGVSLLVVLPMFALLIGVSVYALLWLDTRERVLSGIISLFFSLIFASVWIVDDATWFVRFNRNTSVFLTHLAVLSTQYTLIFVIEEVVAKVKIKN